MLHDAELIFSSRNNVAADHELRYPTSMQHCLQHCFLNMFELNCSVFQRCPCLNYAKICQYAFSFAWLMVELFSTGSFLLILIIGEKSRSISSGLCQMLQWFQKSPIPITRPITRELSIVLLYWPCNISVNTVKTEHSRSISSLSHGNCLA